MVKKLGGKYAVLSESTGRKFGTYKTKTEAQKRLRQVEFFKHLSKSEGRKPRKERQALDLKTKRR